MYPLPDPDSRSPRAHVHPPRWQHWRRFGNRHISPAERTWLLDEGSLTERLTAASGNRFRVIVLDQRWRRPAPWERDVLGMRDGAVALVREVLLECAGQPWVFARSVLPATSLRGKLRYLRRFGARSLGAALFATRGIQRDAFQLARIDPRSLPIARSLSGSRPLWGRRSRLCIDGMPVLVAEVFLPACPL